MVWWIVIAAVAFGALMYLFARAPLTVLVAGLALMILYGNPGGNADIVLTALLVAAMIGDFARYRSRQRQRAAALIELEAQRQAAIGERVAEIMRGKIVAVAGKQMPNHGARH